MRDRYPVCRLCKLLGVSRSGYYDWLRRSSCEDADGDSPIAELIKKCQETTRFTYGYRRVKIWLLRETGVLINHKAVLRIMNKYGLCAQIRRRRKYRRLQVASHKYANLLARDFSAAEPNKRWVTDITQLPTRDGVLYASAIKDLYDGSVVAYAIGREQSVRLVLKTLRAAVANAGPLGDHLIIHSDQGTQYGSDSYNKELAKLSIIPSMSSAGTPLDNAAMESFFSSMKTEWVRRTSKMSYAEVRKLVEEYICFYNNVRIRIDSQSTPMEKRQAS